MRDDLAAVVLAAGSGERLWPLTTLLPKALCPVGNRPLVDHALERVTGVLRAAGVPVDGIASRASIAVNAHHARDAVIAHIGDRAHLSVEEDRALGTAGGVGNLRAWIDGRDVLVANGDAWLGSAMTDFATGWDRERVRLLVVPAARRRGDFGATRYAGMCLLPGVVAAGLSAEPSGLYEVLWRSEWDAERLDLVERAVPFVDCGTPADYLAANLTEVAYSADPATGMIDESARVAAYATVERSVVGAAAAVRGDLVDSVVWPGSEVHRGESLHRSIRAGRLTVAVR